MRAMADTQLLTSFLKFASDRTRPQANGLTSQSDHSGPAVTHLPPTLFPRGTRPTRLR